VTAEAGPGIEGHEAEWFCGCAIDNFENIEIHAQAELLQFVNQRDIHAAKDIFEQLPISAARGADGNYFRDDLGIESARLRVRWQDSRHQTTLGNLREAELLVTRIFPLRESEIEIGGDVFVAVRDGAAQTAFFENREHQLFGCSG
jgi:hypothetical protein